MAIDAELENVPVAYFRPLTGLIQTTPRLNGDGQLEIENNTSYDNAVQVVPESNPLENLVIAFVRAGEPFIIVGIPDDKYIVYFVSGFDWDGTSWTRDVQGSRFVDTFIYETTLSSYRYIKITLGPVFLGTARTVPVNTENIPLVTPDASDEGH